MPIARSLVVAALAAAGFATAVAVVPQRTANVTPPAPHHVVTQAVTALADAGPVPPLARTHRHAGKRPPPAIVGTGTGTSAARVSGTTTTTTKPKATNKRTDTSTNSSSALTFHQHPGDTSTSGTDVSP